MPRTSPARLLLVGALLPLTLGAPLLPATAATPTPSESQTPTASRAATPSTTPTSAVATNPSASQTTASPTPSQTPSASATPLAPTPSPVATATPAVITGSAAQVVRGPYVVSLPPVRNTQGTVTRYADGFGKPVVAYARPTFNTTTAGMVLRPGTAVTGTISNGWMHLPDGRWLPLTSTVASPTAGRTAPTSNQVWTAVPGFDVESAKLNAYTADLAYIGKVNGNRATGTAGFQAGVNYVVAKLRAAGYTPTTQVFTTKAGKRSVNVIVELPGTSTDVVMMGAHLDSVPASPGGNDNSTGAASVLRMAELYKLTNLPHRQTIRFAFWGAEETGKEGSQAYTYSLGAAGRARIKGYFNIDMVASPNPGYYTYGSSLGATALEQIYRTRLGVTPQREADQGRSDHLAFAKYNIGIQYTGVKSGWSINRYKTAAQATTLGWGGTAGALYDRYYHTAGDTFANVSTTALDRAADAGSVWLFRWAGYVG